jgi:bifunctional non-homologous end joining protein LigD
MLLRVSLLKKQTGKGYTTDISGVVFNSLPEEQVHSGVFCQLLNEITPAQSEALIFDDDWFMQEKEDGRRRPVKCSAGNIMAINRKGLVVSMAEPIVIGCSVVSLINEWIIDSEDMGSYLMVFDLLEQGGRDLRGLGAKQRWDALCTFMGMASGFTKDGSIGLVKTAFTTAEKKALKLEVQARNGEGLVFKRCDAPYVAGCPASGGTQLKLKFTESATCKVTTISKTKRSVSLSLLDVNGDWIDQGGVKVPYDQPIPSVGQLVEVRYLPPYEGNRLTQALFLYIRDDVEVDACTLLQLKYRPRPIGGGDVNDNEDA